MLIEKSPMAMTYAIHLLNDKIYIENVKQNIMFSICKNTYQIHPENSTFRKLKLMEKKIATEGILGIIELLNGYYLIYITQSNILAVIKGVEINQITQVSFIPLSTVPNHLIQNHKTALSSFQNMIRKGLFYYSLTYDLTNVFQYQRGYLDYKIAKTDYLWNNNFITYFLKSNIQVEAYFVFCICGYISTFSSALKEKELVHTFIARKKRFNYKANHTQIESIISYNDKSIFNYVMYSFGYSSDIIQGETICMNNFKKYYSHYNQPSYKCTNLIINILDNNNSASDSIINRIIFKTFDKSKFFQFCCLKEFSKEIKSFIAGILDIIHAFEYNLINKKKNQEEIVTEEEEISLTQEPRLQKGFFIIISNDGNFSPIEFQRNLLLEVIKLFFTKFKIEDNNDMFRNLNNEIKKLFGYNEGINRDNAHLSIENAIGNSNANINMQKANIFPKSKPSVTKWSFKEKYDAMFNDYLKQTVSIDQFNDYTAMSYFLIEQQIKPLEKFNYQIKPTEIKKETLTVYIATWNVGALSIHDNQDISPLLHPLNYCGYINKNPVDLYLIGLQEIVKLNPHLVLFASNEAAVNYWVETISKEIPSYELVSSMSLVGVLFMVFTKRSIKKDLKDIQTQIIKTGFFGTLGNKGSCSIRFTYHGKTFAFASGHLAAGNGSNDHRISELNSIASFVFDKDRRFCNSDYWFIFGDMNFRIDLDSQNVLLYIEALYLGFLKANDQLIQNKKKLDFEYEEEDIIFSPSYKFFPKTNKYNSKRTPSWCDRIIYKATKHIKALAYNKIELLCSDHMPVIGIFQATMTG